MMLLARMRDIRSSGMSVDGEAGTCAKSARQLRIDWLVLRDPGPPAQVKRSSPKKLLEGQHSRIDRRREHHPGEEDTFLSAGYAKPGVL
jgi:hypothetical protein